jgi:hypothetical protein
MGAIRDLVTGRVYALEAHHLIGRSHRCSLRLTESSVSGEHASLRWTGGAWAIKDLGSRYGTFVNTRPLQPGIPMSLNCEARLAFGRDSRTWVVTDDSPPEVMAMADGTGESLLQRDGLIAIPSVDRPVAVLFQNAQGSWVLEQAGRVDIVQEQTPFVVEGGIWRLCNASLPQPTSMTGDGRETMGLTDVQLRFRISRNEEHVDLSARWRDRVVELGARSHHYALVTLARIRLRDAAAGEPPSAAGWIEVEELLRQLQHTPERLNLDIFRARRQFGAAGFVPGAGIVERRPATKQVRIGVGDLIVETT